MIINVETLKKSFFLSGTVSVIEASLDLQLTSLIAFLRSSHSFHSYDLTWFVSIGWMSVCTPLSHLVIGFACKLSPGFTCKTTSQKKKKKKETVTKKWNVRAGSSVRRFRSNPQLCHWIISECMYVFNKGSVSKSALTSRGGAMQENSR